MQHENALKLASVHIKADAQKASVHMATQAAQIAVVQLETETKPSFVHMTNGSSQASVHMDSTAALAPKLAPALTEPKASIQRAQTAVAQLETETKPSSVHMNADAPKASVHMAAKVAQTNSVQPQPEAKLASVHIKGETTQASVHMESEPPSLSFVSPAAATALSPKEPLVGYQIMTTLPKLELQAFDSVAHEADNHSVHMAPKSAPKTQEQMAEMPALECVQMVIQHDSEAQLAVSSPCVQDENELSLTLEQVGIEPALTTASEPLEHAVQDDVEAQSAVSSPCVQHGSERSHTLAKADIDHAVQDDVKAQAAVSSHCVQHENELTHTLAASSPEILLPDPEATTRFEAHVQQSTFASLSKVRDFAQRLFQAWDQRVLVQVAVLWCRFWQRLI